MFCPVRGSHGPGLIYSHFEGPGEEKRKRRKRGSTLAPTPSDSCRRTSTCLSSEQAVEEASLWWRVRPVHVQVWAQRPVSLVDIDFFEALHLIHLHGNRGPSYLNGCLSLKVRRASGWFVYSTADDVYLRGEIGLVSICLGCKLTPAHTVSYKFTNCTHWQAASTVKQ